MRISYFFYFLLLLSLLACDEDGPEDLPPVEERLSAAINNLRSELTAPVNGWILDYQPNESSGFFQVLLKFEPDGKVTIQTDSPENDGEFYSQTSTYRIDNAQGLELILENYGFFHFLFEQAQTTFGGEFEFLFDRKEGENLVFGSLSDFSDRTVLVFKPASDSDANSLVNSRTQVELFQEMLLTSGPRFSVEEGFIVEEKLARFQLALTDLNVSIDFVLDFDTRLLKAVSAGRGLTVQEIIANNTTVLLNHDSGFGFENGNLVLESPLAFSFDGIQVVIARMQLSNFTEENIIYCEGLEDNALVYEASVLGIGSSNVNSGIFSSATKFGPDADNIYFISTEILYDENGESLEDEIEDLLPGAVGFQLYYGIDGRDGELNALGFVTVDESNNVDFFLRRFDLTSQGNLHTINLIDEFVDEEELMEEQKAVVISITNRIFESNQFYTLDFAGDFDTNLEILSFFNPCNRYEFFMLKSIDQ